MSNPSPSLTPIIARLEALLEYARRPDLGPGDLDEPLIEAVNEIRAMTVEVLARERAAALPGAAFPPSGLPALRPRAHAADWPKAQKGKNARRRDRL